MVVSRFRLLVEVDIFQVVVDFYRQLSRALVLLLSVG